MGAVVVSVPGHPGRVSEDCADASTEGDVVAVADGVGSAALGSLGSHTAVSLVLGELREAARSGATPEAIAARLVERYREVTGGERDVATTCLFAMVDGDRVVVGQVGDGLAGVLATHGWEPLPSARGEWSNQTSALPRAPALCRAWRTVDVRAVFLATDGVSDDLVPGREAELVAGLAALAEREGLPSLGERLRAWLLNWPTRASLDDRSVALLIPGVS